MKVVIRMVGALLVAIGSLVWQSRLDYRPEEVIQRTLGRELMPVDPSQSVDLSATCEQSRISGGWVLFVVEGNVISDEKTRLYFETAPKPYGLWLESDPEILQVGLGLGDDVNSSTQIPVRIIRNDTRELIVIAVTSNKTRVVANAVDNVSNWPGSAYPQWQCGSVQIGNGLRELSEGDTCEDCDAKVSVAFGRESEELNTLLDSLVNIEEFNFRRWSGTLTVLVGFALLLVQVNRRT